MTAKTSSRQGCREHRVTPHVAAKGKQSAVDARITRQEGYKVSLRVRKRIEEVFGWVKTAGGLGRPNLIGHAKLAGQALLCFATYNLGNAWAASAVGGTRIMREARPHQCARNGQKTCSRLRKGLRRP